LIVLAINCVNPLYAIKIEPIRQAGGSPKAIRINPDHHISLRRKAGPMSTRKAEP